MRAWRLPEEFWVQESVLRSPAEKSWQAVLRHQIRAPSHLTRRGRCWTHKASSPAHCRRGASRCSSPGLVKTEFANNCEYQGKEWIISAKYRAFGSKTSSWTYGEMHSISRIFDCIRTTLRRGEFPVCGIPPSVTEGGANTVEFCEILRKFKLFARFSQGFRKGFF